MRADRRCHRAPRAGTLARAVLAACASLALTPGAGLAGLLPTAADTDAALHPRAPHDSPQGTTIVVEVDRDGVPADGQSPVRVRVRLTGAAGAPVTGRRQLTIEHSGGRLQLPGARTDEFGPRALDADRAAPGVQMDIDNGRAEFLLLAPAEAQDVRLRVSVDGQTAAGTIRFVPDLRPMVAAGLVEGVIGLRERIALQPARRGDAFEREIESWAREFSDGRGVAAARAAFYLKGTVRGDLLLSAAYDSDKELRSRLLRDIRPDELYPVYGDASLRHYDARSGSRLYLRVDRDRSYLLYGDIVTGDGFSQPAGQGATASLKQRSLAQVNRSATGLRAHHEHGGLVANVFVFNDTLRQVVEEFASQGSGPYGLRHGAVLEGSEKLEIVTRDRNQPSRIVAVQPLQRLVDYGFEPFSGRILLARFLPAFDADLNPVSLRVSYEVDQGGEAFWAGGVDAQWKIAGTPFELGGAVWQDRNALAPYDLVGANATWRPGPRTVAVVELARSRAEVNTNLANQVVTPGLAASQGEVQGQAWRVEVVHEGERVAARLFAGRSEPTFHNPAAPLNGGRGEVQAKASYRLDPAWQAYTEGWRSEDRATGGGVQQAAGVGLRWQAAERLTLDLGLRQQDETVGTRSVQAITSPFGLTSGLSGSLASGAAGGVLGFGAQPLDPASGLPIVAPGSALPGASALPAGTELSSRGLRLGAGWRVDERLQLGASLETDLSGDNRRRVTLGADYAVWERTRLYGRWEQQQGWVQLGGTSDTGRRASVLAAGVASEVWRDTQLFSEYRLRDAISGRDLQLASGVRHGWDLAPGWRAQAAVEDVRVLDGAQPRARAVAGGLDWSADPLWRASGNLEWRRSGDVGATPEVDEQFDTVLWRLMVARKLDRDWTLLARHHLLRTTLRAGGAVDQSRAVAGLAYRDTDTNRVNALAKLEHKLERDTRSAALGDLRSSAWIASLHADHRPSRQWWLTGRVAGKWQQDRFEQGVDDRFRAALVSGRVVHDLSERWDLGLMAAVQAGQHGARQHAVGAEIGYLLATNLWLSAGVNATGFTGDADLAGNDYTRQGAYLRLRFKFDELLFKAGDRQANRSLDR